MATERKIIITFGPCLLPLISFCQTSIYMDTDRLDIQKAEDSFKIMKHASQIPHSGYLGVAGRGLKDLKRSHLS